MERNNSKISKERIPWIWTCGRIPLQASSISFFVDVCMDSFYSLLLHTTIIFEPFILRPAIQANAKQFAIWLMQQECKWSTHMYKNIPMLTKCLQWINLLTSAVAFNSSHICMYSFPRILSIEYIIESNRHANCKLHSDKLGGCVCCVCLFVELPTYTHTYTKPRSAKFSQLVQLQF